MQPFMEIEFMEKDFVLHSKDALYERKARTHNHVNKEGTLNSVYNEVAFNEKSAITKENLCTKYFPFTYNDVTLKEKLPVMKENFCILFFITGRVECKIQDHDNDLQLKLGHG